MKSDADNLREFARSGDETAFREIVERHAPMVHGVAWRQTQDRSLAEDVTQTVFAILARKAAAISHQELAGWLHRAAFIETRNASRKESRRHKALAELTSSMSDEPANEPAWRDVRPHLDELLGRLSAEDRQLVVMRYFEQLSYREISATTGRTEEASRKQMQRALDRLSGLLKGRKVAASGTALATILAAQTLCSPTASAAVIAAGALKAAPAIAGSVSFTHSLYLMTTQTIIKTSVVALVIAAAPMAVLWNQNNELKHEIAQLKTHPGSSGAHDEPGAMAVSLNETPQASRPERPDRPAPTEAKEKEKEPGIMDAFSSLLKSDSLTTILESEAKKNSLREFNRLTARLNLTEEQQKSLRDFFDRRNQVTGEMLKEVKDSGLLERSMSGEKELNAEDKAMIERLAAKEEKDLDVDALLDSILTPEQKTQQVQAKEEQRTEAARASAQQTIDDVGNHVELSTEQKDQLFDAIAQKRLSEDSKPKASDDTLNLRDMLEKSDDAASGDDDVLSQVLTPAQMAALTKNRAEEAAQMEEMLKSLIPAAPKKGHK
ncbi:MAG: polymerase, sigma-24 subunit, subfamily [Akkermansiaceae bacterium]|nr:polymerase, sigma-24 subunit, subfamily [Akkermansiaceae bacterium]